MKLFQNPEVYHCVQNISLPEVMSHDWGIKKGEGKAVPLHAMEALGGRRGIAPTHSGPRHQIGVSGQRHAPAALLSPGKGPPVPIVQEAGWAPEPVWTQRLEEKSSAPCRGSNPDCPVVQPVVQHYTAWANPAPKDEK
jgi:hypothetical protein